MLFPKHVRLEFLPALWSVPSSTFFLIALNSMFQEYVVRPMVWNSLPTELQRNFHAPVFKWLQLSLRRFVNFQLLSETPLRDQSLCSKEVTPIELDKVELLRMLAVFYQNKHNPRDFLEVKLLLLGFGSSLLLYFGVTGSLKLSSLLALKFSWCLVLIRTVSLKDMKGILIKSVAIHKSKRNNWFIGQLFQNEN